ncbi:MAG: DUF4112 domain-containing protein [Thermoanaerobaculia bacterium]
MALRALARLLDEAVAIPGTKRRVGLDAVFGLVPGIGDFLGALCSLWIVMGALRHRVPFRHVARMTWNILVDSVVGAVPFAGDLFDVFWDSNVWNVELIVKHRDVTRPPRTNAQVGLTIGLIALLVLGVLMATLVLVLNAATALFQKLF